MMHQKVLIWLAAGGFNLLGLTWLYTFIFTDYRNHWSKVMIPVGIISILFSLGLFYQKLPFVVGLVLLATCTSITTICILASSGAIHPLLLAVGVVSAIYACVLGPAAFKALRDNKTTS
ncbi:MAG TPA: hypothetical protein DCX54_08020 [Flavobacteriales bacterium]|nr:hypothetical protein [Flavobacteriales bacterium]